MSSLGHSNRFTSSTQIQRSMRASEPSRSPVLKSEISGHRTVCLVNRSWLLASESTGKGQKPNARSVST